MNKIDPDKLDVVVGKNDVESKIRGKIKKRDLGRVGNQTYVKDRQVANESTEGTENELSQ